MPTLRAAIALYDGVTSPLKHMATTMNVVLNTFESLQGAASKAVDTAAIQEGREQMARFSAEIDAVENSLNQADEQQRRFNQSMGQGAGAADGMLSKLKQIGTVVASYAGIQKAVRLSDTYASTNARLNLLVDDGGSREALEQQIMASAQRSRAGYFDTASAVAKLGLNAGAAFEGNDELIAFMEQVNKQFVIGGATAQEQSNAMIQLTQAMAAGALRGEELNSILDGAPGIARAIEQYMGVAEGSIKEYASEGLVTSQVVKNALFAAAEETNAKFGSMPKTWAQVWTSMENKALAVFSPILQQINDLANDDRLSHVLDGFIGALGVTAGVIGKVLGLAVAFGGAVYDNWGWIGPIVLGIAGALGVYAAGLAVVNTVETVSNGLKLAAAVAAYAKAAATGTAVSADTAATAAQWGLNAALLACPLTWIVLAVVAVIAVIYAAVGAVNHFAGTSVSATGLICGVITTAAAFIWNTIIGLLNGAIQLLWTVFVYPYLGVIEWIVNATTGGFDSLGDAAANIVGQIIGWFISLGQVVTTILDAIFGWDWTSKLESVKGEVTSWGKNENAVSFDKSAPLLDARWAYGDAYDTGYQFGKGIDDKVKGAFSLDGMDAFGLGGNLDGIYAGVGDTAYNTAAMADEMDIAEENLAYMRDIAEREAINRYTTAQVTIHQQNENHISSQMDLDGVMDAFGTGLAEQMAVSGEGVHE